jgi:hypothetical protein
LLFEKRDFSVVYHEDQKEVAIHLLIATPNVLSYEMKGAAKIFFFCRVLLRQIRISYFYPASRVYHIFTPPRSLFITKVISRVFCDFLAREMAACKIVH